MPPLGEGAFVATLPCPKMARFECPENGLPFNIYRITKNSESLSNNFPGYASPVLDELSTINCTSTWRYLRTSA